MNVGDRVIGFYRWAGCTGTVLGVDRTWSGAPDVVVQWDHLEWPTRTYSHYLDLV